MSPTARLALQKTMMSTSSGSCSSTLGASPFALTVDEPELRSLAQSPRDTNRQRLLVELENVECVLQDKVRQMSELAAVAHDLGAKLSQHANIREAQVLQAKVEEQHAVSSRELQADVKCLAQRKSALLESYVNQGLMREWPAPQPHNRDKIASPATMQLTEILRTLGDVQAGPTGLSPEQDALPQRDAHDAKRKKRRLNMTIASGPLQHGYTKAGGGESLPPAVPSPPADLVVRCHCKKSRCLKLYCECFAAQKMCGGDCKCVDCENNAKHATRRDTVIQSILGRRPNAFETKIFVKPAPAAAVVPIVPVAGAAVAHARGCTCRRSRCLKKYCVCYNERVACGEWCRCIACQNGNAASAKEVQVSSQSSLDSLPDSLAVLATMAAVD